MAARPGTFISTTTRETRKRSKACPFRTCTPGDSAGAHVIPTLWKRQGGLQATCSTVLRQEQAAAIASRRLSKPFQSRIQRPKEMDLSIVSLEPTLAQVWAKIREAQAEQQREAQVSPPQVQLSPRHWVAISGFASQQGNESPPTASAVALFFTWWAHSWNLFLRLCGPKPINAETRTATTESSSHCFSILQFNMLARGLSSGPFPVPPFIPEKRDANWPKTASHYYGGFTSVPHYPTALDFNWRKWRLLEVLLGGDVAGAGADSSPCTPPLPLYDILAVEEMDHYDDFFRPLLESACHYDSFFVPKMKSPSLARFGWYSDGCALFWNRRVFELVDQQWSAYRVGQSQVYALLTLRHLHNKKLIAIAVTHLKAQVDKDAIRSAQVKQLLQEVSQQVDCLESDDDQVAAVLMVGDFNAPLSSPSMQEIVSQSSFESAYGDTPVLPYTTWKTRGQSSVQRTVDYIWYSSSSSSSLACQAALGPPQEARELPGLHYPSDHLAIAAQFKLE